MSRRLNVLDFQNCAIFLEQRNEHCPFICYAGGPPATPHDYLSRIRTGKSYCSLIKDRAGLQTFVKMINKD
jgi:hypothetical protein